MERFLLYYLPGRITMKQELTRHILEYKQGRLTANEALNLVAVYIYTFLQHRYHSEEDTASEIFCALYRRLPGMIESFDYRGRPFEIYLHITVKRVTISYFQDRRRNECLRRFSEETYCSDRLVSLPEEPPEQDCEKIGRQAAQYFELDQEKRIAPEHLRRRMLCLVCKSAYHLSYPQIVRSARMTGVSASWLEERIGRLKKSMAPRLKRYEYLSEQRREYMARARIYHERLTTAVNEECDIYRRRYSMATRRVKALSRSIQRIPVHPTHTEIARVLCIPKGSVDSGLHYLKNGLGKKKPAHGREETAETDNSASRK